MSARILFLSSEFDTTDELPDYSALLTNNSNAQVIRNERLRIGRYTQHFVDTLPLEHTPVSYLQNLGTMHDSPPFQAVQRCRAQVKIALYCAKCLIICA